MSGRDWTLGGGAGKILRESIGFYLEEE